MIARHTLAAARAASAARPDRPAMAIIHDGPDARLVVFRLSPGQFVAPHRSSSTVMLQVLEGIGVISHEDRDMLCTQGDLLVFEPNELHGMRAQDEELLLLATMTPRPSSRQQRSNEDSATTMRPELRQFLQTTAV
ncbi:MAG: AraC family ligand binding domain-containing protein [Gemmatimonadota bacterium]|nr:AraC family ligand binding domain-containing protein [Gemmatimonadota bacterium]